MKVWENLRRRYITWRTHKHWEEACILGLMLEYRPRNYLRKPLDSPEMIAWLAMGLKIRQKIEVHAAVIRVNPAQFELPGLLCRSGIIPTPYWVLENALRTCEKK